MGLGWWLGFEPCFKGAVKALDFALGGGVVGAAVFLFYAQVGQELFEGVGLVVGGAPAG